MPHPSVSVDETINGWYSDLQVDTHTINGYRKAMYTCEVCWNSWDGEALGTELVSRVENRDFVEDGFCFWCNFPNPCAHEHMEAYGCLLELTYSDITGTTHTVTGTQGIVVICQYCDQLISEEEGQTQHTEAEEHCFDDGVCVCGYRNTVPTRTEK